MMGWPTWPPFWTWGPWFWMDAYVTMARAMYGMSPDPDQYDAKELKDE